MQVHEDSGIEKPEDLIGKTTGLNQGGIQVPLFNALVAANGLDASQIEVVNVDAGALLNLFQEREVDAYITIPGFELPKLAERGLTARFLNLRDFGVPILGHSLAVRG